MGVPPGFGNARPESPAQQQAPQQGGSFLGTAAAAAAGVIGGSLLLDSIRSITGGSRQALAEGQDPAALRDEGQKLKLLSRCSRLDPDGTCIVRVFRDYVFVFNSQSLILVTIYPAGDPDPVDPREVGYLGSLKHYDGHPL